MNHGLIALLAFSFALILSSGIALARVNLPWSTTFNCPEWTFGVTLSCDGLSPGGAEACWTGGADEHERITAPANGPGSVGKGQRHFLGDGVNINSGGLDVYFNTPQSEVWIRWYMKFETGFKWSGYEGFKIIYLKDQNLQNLNYFQIAQWGADNLDYYAQVGDMEHHRESTAGWSNIFCGGGSTSDGSWHFIELHIKSETPGNSDGILQWWVDGVLKGNFNNVNHGLASAGRTIGGFTIGSNSKYPDNGKCMAVDFDDIAVSNTGYIGPIGTSPPPYCGDQSCNNGETCSNCPQDCGSCSGWTFCANEYEFCSFTGTKEVRYGANGIYAYGTYTDGVLCDNSVFGDPIQGVEKQCYYRDATPTCIHKSDSDCNGCVSDTELSAFIDRWHLNNQDVTLKELMEAIGFWKRGGCP